MIDGVNQGSSDSRSQLMRTRPLTRRRDKVCVMAGKVVQGEKLQAMDDEMAITLQPHTSMNTK